MEENYSASFAIKKWLLQNLLNERTQAVLKGAVSRHLYKKFRHWERKFAPCKGIHGRLGFWIPRVDSGFQALDFAGIFCQWNMDSGLQSFLGSGLLGLYAGFQSPSLPIPLEKLPGFPYNKLTKWHLKR